MQLRPFDSCTSELSTRQDSVVLIAVCRIGVGPREAKPCLEPLRSDWDVLCRLVSEEIEPEIRSHRDNLGHQRFTNDRAGLIQDSARKSGRTETIHLAV